MPLMSTLLAILILLVGTPESLGSDEIRTIGLRGTNIVSHVVAQPGESDLGEEVQVNPNQIVVRTDEWAYRLGEEIRVEVANGLPFTIYTPDHQTNCSFVTLDWWSGTRWQSLSACGWGGPTSFIPIGTGRRHLARINTDAKDLNTAAAVGRAGLRDFPQGDFRISFGFRLDPRARGPFIVTRSRIFRVSAQE